MGDEECLCLLTSALSRWALSVECVRVRAADGMRYADDDVDVLRKDGISMSMCPLLACVCWGAFDLGVGVEGAMPCMLLLVC
jgi:hypothetical protein